MAPMDDASLGKLGLLDDATDSPARSPALEIGTHGHFMRALERDDHPLRRMLSRNRASALHTYKARSAEEEHFLVTTGHGLPFYRALPERGDFLRHSERGDATQLGGAHELAVNVVEDVENVEREDRVAVRE